MQPISCARHCGTTDLNFHKLEPAGNFHSSQDTTYYATDLLPVRENKGASADIQACTHVQLNITFKLILADFLAQCFRSFRKTVSLEPCTVYFGGVSAIASAAPIALPSASPCGSIATSSPIASAAPITPRCAPSAASLPSTKASSP